VKHVKDILYEMYDDGVEKQADWLVTYRIDPIQMGRMCEEYPALQKSWNEFKLVYELCRSQDDINRQIS
jgi:hypothetical protein